MMILKAFLLILGIWIFGIIAVYYITRTIVVAYHEGMDLYKSRKERNTPYGQEEEPK